MTGLDYFGARYFSGALGRFTSPDEVFADQQPGDPQSWNLYAYVRNNPLRYTDPTGMSAESDHAEQEYACQIGVGDCTSEQAAKKAAQQQAKTAQLGGTLRGFVKHGWNAFVDLYAWACDSGTFTEEMKKKLKFDTSSSDDQRGGMIFTAATVLLPGGGRAVALLEEDAGAIHLAIKSEKYSYEIMANMRWEGKTLILDQTHIGAEGGVGAIGAGIRTELQEAARQFGRQMGAEEVVINPGARLGGRGAVTSLKVRVQ